MHRVPAFALLILTIWFAPRLLAQSTNAPLTSRITDSSKAAIADAKIAPKIRNEFREFTTLVISDHA